MYAFNRFSAEVDLHIVAMLVLLVPFALAIGASASASQHPHRLLACIIAIFPQFRMLTRCVDLRRFGRSSILYLLVNEILVALIATSAVGLNVVFRSMHSR